MRSRGTGRPAWDRATKAVGVPRGTVVWGPRFKKAADHEKKSLQLGAVKKLQSPTKAFTPLARGAQPQHTSRSALTYTHASIIRDTVPPVVKHPVRCCRRPRVQKKLALHLHSPPRAESCFVFPVTAGVQVFKVPNICSCMHERRVLPFIELEVGHTPSPLSRIQRRWCPADHPHRARAGPSSRSPRRCSIPPATADPQWARSAPSWSSYLQLCCSHARRATPSLGLLRPRPAATALIRRCT